MNGRQSGAVRYLASSSLYYYSLGLLRRSVSSLVCVVPAFFFCSLLLTSAPCHLSLSFSAFLLPLFSSCFPFSSPLASPSSGLALSPLRLFRFNGLSRSFTRYQVRRTGDRTSCTTCFSYRFEAHFLCASPRARIAGKLTVIFPTS